MDRRSRVCVIVAVVVALLAVAVAVWALFFRDPTPDPVPDIAPGVEENALPTGEDDDEKLPQAQGGGAVNITYSNQVAVSLAEGSASLQFTNPARSNQSMVVQVVIQDVVVAQSGTLLPGNRIEQLPLNQGLSLAAGQYEGIFRILFYNTEDGSRAQVSTEIPISVAVSS